MSSEVGRSTDRLRRFLFDRVYIGSEAKKDEAKARHLVEELYAYFLTHPEQLPKEYTEVSGGKMERAACDYIAGMTDRFAKGGEFCATSFPGPLVTVCIGIDCHPDIFPSWKP